MGAGTTQDHYIQDAAESYIVARLQRLATDMGVNLSDSAKEKEDNFTAYCVERNIVSDFAKSVYKTNIDSIVEKFFSNIISKFPGQKFDIIDVEREYRDLKLKGDFVIEFENGTRISFSLKNYKKGFNRIQLCSGTWHSFLNNFLFESSGVGMFIDPFNGDRFKGSNREYRDGLIDKMGYGALTNVYNFFDEVNDTIREFYTYGEQADSWSNVASKWKSDCAEYGLKAAQVIIPALDSISKDTVKQRIIKMAGLNYDEEILLVGKGEYLCSLFNDKYGKMLERVNSVDCVVEYSTNKKGVLFTLRDSVGVIVSIEVPFTLQKNGAWFIPKAKYSGTQYHEKEGVNLAYGQRRPKKSKEINTSTNTYLNLKKAGVV